MPKPLPDGRDIEVQIAEIMGINKEQAAQGSMSVSFESSLVVVRWEGLIVATEEQRDKIIEVMTETKVRIG